MTRFLVYAGLFVILSASWLVGCDRAARAQTCLHCNTQIYQLEYQGRVVSFGDMSESECAELKTELEVQTKPFTDLECKPVWVAREQI